MAAGDILTILDTNTAFTITLASLLNNTARQSTMINNSGNKYGALVYVTLTSGGVAPTANSTYEVFLLRSNTNSSPTYRSDNAGASDATITIENAKLIGLIALTATTAKAFYGEFDTSPLGPLGPEWGIAIRNSSGQTISATEGNHLAGYTYHRQQVQSS
jgi:hypothetical protein